MGTRLTILRRRTERLKNDTKYAEKVHKCQKVYRDKNREKIKIKRNIWDKELSDFRNHRCKECNKLLNYQTKGNYCRAHKHL